MAFVLTRYRSTGYGLCEDRTRERGITPRSDRRCLHDGPFGTAESPGTMLVCERRVAYQAGTSVESLFEVLDHRWVLHIVQFLAEGPRRFNEIAASRSINTNTLTSRLKELEANGLVRREVLTYIPPHVEYSLTAQGLQLAEALQRIAELAVSWNFGEDTPHGYAIVAEPRQAVDDSPRGGRKGLLR